MTLRIHDIAQTHFAFKPSLNIQKFLHPSGNSCYQCLRAEYRGVDVLT